MHANAGDWAGVGSQCVRFAAAFAAVDWDQVDMHVENDAAALDKNLRADDQRAEYERQDLLAVRKVMAHFVAILSTF